jgi:hypothetical protein
LGAAVTRSVSPHPAAPLAAVALFVAAGCATAPAPPDILQVNDSVNAEIAFRNDPAGSVATLDPVYGDCEDYAITKLDRLVRRGWPIDRFRLVVFETRNGVNHAVLLVRTEGGTVYSLDNMVRSARIEGQPLLLEIAGDRLNGLLAVVRAQRQLGRPAGTGLADLPHLPAGAPPRASPRE